ncbi:MAG: hypothetical protein WBR13_12380 [Allosphingosinicella sp.]
MRAEAAAVSFTRVAVPTLTQTSIRNTSTGRDSRAVRLIDSIFGLLPAVYGDPLLRQPYPTPPGRDTGILSDSWIAKEFYTRHFCPVELVRDNGGVPVTTEDFLDELTTFGISEQRNKIFFLQSEIGSGKTALINHLITKHGKKLFHEKDVWFVRLNVDVMRDANEDDFNGFFRALENKLSVIVTKLIERHQEDLSSPDVQASLQQILSLHCSVELNSTDEARQSRLREALLAISNVLGKRLLLIIDNMDYIVHERDRYQFLKPKEDIDRGYLILIRRIVASFYQPDSLLSDIGANVLFSVRPDTYHLMKATNFLVPMARIPFADNRHLFTLQGPSWDDVVSERASLLKRCLEKIQPEGVAAEVRRHTIPLLQSLSDAPRRQRLFRHLRQISVYGLRGVLNFFGDYTWFPANNSETESIVTTRFLDSYQLGLLAFMLNNKVAYTQNEANFPNVFYANLTPDEEVEEISHPFNGPDAPRNVSRAHWQTYWLKRFLLEFIRARNEAGVSLKPEDIYEVFCAEENGLGYTEDLIRLCLGSFSQTHVSDLICVTREMTGDRQAIRIENIELTPRAVHCLDSIFDTFPYLQLVVDDYLMPLPRTWIREFAISGQYTYRYLTAPQTEFIKGARQMITFKAGRVARFLALLAEAMAAERLSKPILLARLKKENVRIPDPVQIWERVLGELTSLSSGGAHVDIAELRSKFPQWRREIRSDILASYGLPDRDAGRRAGSPRRMRGARSLR